jgi:hypothetical protein
MAPDKSQSKSDILQGTLDLMEKTWMPWDRCTGGPEQRASGYAGGHGAGRSPHICGSHAPADGRLDHGLPTARASCDTR